LHYEQKHPEFLLNPREFAQLNMRWKPNTRIQMFWKNEDHPQGGEYVPENTLIALEHHALFGCPCQSSDSSCKCLCNMHTLLSDVDLAQHSSTLVFATATPDV